VRELRGQGVRLSEIALLYRSNAQSRVLEHALFNAGLPYRVYGGLRFFERQEIKHALAYLRLVANPEDDGAFLRVVNIPARGIGNRSLEQLQELSRLRGVSLWQAACSSPLSGKGGQGMTAFVQLIQGLRLECAALSLAETVDHVIDRSGLRAYYQGDRDGQDRIENLDELVNAAAGFQVEEPLFEPAPGVEAPGEAASEQDQAAQALNSFLAHTALEAGEHQAAAGMDALQLMTVHAAKGLEFDAVFISGLEEGLFPHENSLNEGDGVEEERRLMYVAITRARQRLCLSYAQSRMLHGQTRYNLASRFLEEVPSELVRRLGGRGSVRTRRGGPAVTESIAAYAVPSASPWRVGQDVVHPKFGPGVIVNVLGRGDDARVEVNFNQVGRKELVLAYARLSPSASNSR